MNPDAEKWLTPEEQDWLMEMIQRNSRVDIIGNGVRGDPNQWGKQWYLMLVFQRASGNVSFRDPVHGIQQAIPVCQSLPYRLLDYVGEESIPMGIPQFHRLPGAIPFYWPKEDKDKITCATGHYADLMFLGEDCCYHRWDGLITDNSQANAYARKYHGDSGSFITHLWDLIDRNQRQGHDRALSYREVFPHGTASL